MPNKLTIEKLKNSLGKKPAELQLFVSGLLFWLQLLHFGD